MAVSPQLFPIRSTRTATMSWIQTYTGKAFDLLAPAPEQICILRLRRFCLTTRPSRRSFGPRLQAASSSLRSSPGPSSRSISRFFAMNGLSC